MYQELEYEIPRQNQRHRDGYYNKTDWLIFFFSKKLDFQKVKNLNSWYYILNFYYEKLVFTWEIENEHNMTKDPTKSLKKNSKSVDEVTSRQKIKYP